jgi:cytochrome c oxidase assembly factor 2
MPPRFHPRSRLTSSLFATTLLASFLVVGLPHVIPCPAPRIAFADGEMSTDGTTKWRKRRKSPDPGLGGVNDSKKLEDRLIDDEENLEDGVDVTRPPRECLIPKLDGIARDILGFNNDSREHGKGSRRPP